MKTFEQLSILFFFVLLGLQGCEVNEPYKSVANDKELEKIKLAHNGARKANITVNDIKFQWKLMYISTYTEFKIISDTWYYFYNSSNQLNIINRSQTAHSACDIANNITNVDAAYTWSNANINGSNIKDSYTLNTSNNTLYLNRDWYNNNCINGGVISPPFIVTVSQDGEYMFLDYLTGNDEHYLELWFARRTGGPSEP